MKAENTLDKADDVVAALEALSTRLQDDERSTVEQARAVLAELKQLVTTLGGQLAAMKWLAQKQYRPKSEKVPEGQLALDLLGFLLASKGEAPNADDAGSSPADESEGEGEQRRKTPREKRKSKLHLLPVKEERREVPESDRICAECGAVKTEFGHDTCRHLIYVPPRLFILEELLVKYACRPCGNGVVMAESIPKLIPGSPVSSSVLAHLTVSKVVDAMPLERTRLVWSGGG